MLRAQACLLSLLCSLLSKILNNRISITRFKLKNPALQKLKLVWPQTSLSRVLHPTAADSSWRRVTFIASLFSDTPGFDLHRADQIPSIYPSSFTGSLQETMSLHVE